MAEKIRFVCPQCSFFLLALGILMLIPAVETGLAGERGILFAPVGVPAERLVLFLDLQLGQSTLSKNEIIAQLDCRTDAPVVSKCNGAVIISSFSLPLQYFSNISDHHLIGGSQHW